MAPVTPPVAPFESSILSSFSDQKALANLLGGEMKSSLVYRGSRDGFTRQAFHERCDGRKNTLTIVKSEKGRIFGGYTNIAWASQGGLQAKDHQSFLFSFTAGDNQLVQMKNKVGLFEVFHAHDLLPSFVGGFEIHENCQQNSDSYSFLDGDEYALPAGITKYSKEAKTFLAGSEYFRCFDIEVFQITR